MVYAKYCQKIKEHNYNIRDFNNPKIFYGLDSSQNKVFQHKAITALEILHCSGVLDEDNAKIICSQASPHKIYQLILVLKNTGLLGCASIQLSLNLYLEYARDTEYIVEIVYFMQRKGWTNLINNAYFNALFAHPDTRNLYKLLNIYSQPHSTLRFTEAECAALIYHPDPLIIIKKIDLFHESKPELAVHEQPLTPFIMTLELEDAFKQASIPMQLISMISAHEHAWDIFNGIKLLIRINCLRQQNIYTLMEHPKPFYLISALGQLTGTCLIPLASAYDGGFLFAQSQEIIELLAQHPHPHVLNLALMTLRKHGLLTKHDAYEQVMLIIEHPNLHSLTEVMYQLTQTTLFSNTDASTYIQQLMAHDDAWLVNVVLYTIPTFKWLDDQKMQRYFRRINSPDPKAESAKMLLSQYPALVQINSAGSIQLIDDPKACIDTNIVWILSRTGLLNKENVTMLLARKELSLLTELLEILYNLDLLSDQPQSIFNKLMSLETTVSHEELYVHLVFLINVFLLTNPIIRELSFVTARQFVHELMQPKKTYPMLMAFYTWLSYLEGRDSQLATNNLDSEFSLMAQHNKPIELAEAFIFMDKKGLLRGYSAYQNRLIVAAHPDPLAVANAFYLLQQNHLMHGVQCVEQRWLVGTHPHLDEVVSALLLLQRTAILHDDNNSAFCQALSCTAKPYSLAMDALERARIIFNCVAAAYTDNVRMEFYPEYISCALNHAFGLDSASSNRFKLIEQLLLHLEQKEQSSFKPKAIHFFSKARRASEDIQSYWVNKWLNDLIFYPKQSIAAVFYNVLTVSTDAAYVVNQQHGLPQSKAFNAIIDRAAEYAEVGSNNDFDDFITFRS